MWEVGGGIVSKGEQSAPRNALTLIDLGLRNLASILGFFS